MADGSGIDQSDLNSAISELRSELRAEFRADLNELRQELYSEIGRLEEEMRQIGEMIVDAIRLQTLEMTAGIAATTAMVESAKHQIEEDFSKTRGKLDAQIESTLQIEVGKKVAEASGVRDKMAAFIGDIKARFDRAIITSAQNRELYNVAFRNLTDEYGAKIRSIGAHIFQIRLDDIAPAFRAASVPYEEAHGLPIEMDLKRLELRSAQLDDTLELLKSSRLDEVVSSLETLEAQLSAASANIPASAMDNDYCIEAVATRSQLATRVCTGLTALPASAGLNVNLSGPKPGLEVFASEPALDGLAKFLDQGQRRALSADESKRLVSAARNLRTHGLISDDALGLFEDFLGSGSLCLVEA